MDSRRTDAGHTRPVLDAIERLAFALVAITNAAIQGEAHDLDLTLPQWRVLVILGDEGQPMRLHELAARIGGSLPSASRLVRRLERRGLVATAPDASDGRGVRIGLSAEGRRISAAILASRRDLIAAGLQDVDVRLPLETGLADIARALDHWA